jgi:hypothetical protein
MSFPPVPNTEIKSDNVWLSWFRRIYEIFSRWIVVSVSSILLNNPLVRQAVNRNGPTRFESINADPGTSATSFYQASNGTNSVIMVMHGTGHSGGFANQGWVYTTTAVPLILGTNGVERMRIAATGEIGIGGAVAAAYLVQIQAPGTPGVIGALRLVSNGAAASNPTLNLNDTTNAVNVILSCSSGQAEFGTFSNHPLALRTNNIERMRLKSTGQLRFIPLAADPAGLEDGDVWYNSTANKLRVRAGGVTIDLH